MRRIIQVRIKEEDFPELSNSANWIVYESTSSHQERYNVLNLTILSEAAILKFLDGVGLPYDENFLIKIRLYALKIDDVYWCDVLPLVVLPPMNQKNVNLLFESIILQ